MTHSYQLIGSLDLRGGARVDTKVFPVQSGGHSPDNVKASFADSVKALQGKKIRVFYLHKPDRTVPFEDTLEAVNELYILGGLFVSLSRCDLTFLTECP